MKILLISPFHGRSSHAAWARGWQEHSRHSIEIISLEDRGWSWRLKGGCVPLSQSLSEYTEIPDLIVATSLTCLTSLLGLLRRSPLIQVPLVYYMHENQLTYPIREGGKRDSQLVLRQFHSQLTADAIWFNSDFNKREWFEQLPKFLARFKDHQGLDLLEELERKSAVLPVGLSLPQRERIPTSSAQPLMLWNQRWEWEKGTDRFCKLIARLGDADFEVVILGESNPRDPLLVELQELLGSRLLHCGWCEKNQYWQWLERADFTVSVARHEFFGISILEAAAHEVVTFLPNALSYPEILPSALHEPCLYRNLKGLTNQVKRYLVRPDKWEGTKPALSEAARRYTWTKLAPLYDKCCEALAASIVTFDT